jgi:hypothetical protein
MTASRPPRNRSRPYSRHGITRLKTAVRHLGLRVIDRRTTLGKMLAHWRVDLIQDLGGPDAVSTQRAALVDLAVRSKLILDSLDAWLLSQPSLVNKRTRSVLPIVRERQALADGLARYLQALGLDRVERPPVDLGTYLASRPSAPAPADPQQGDRDEHRGDADPDPRPAAGDRG